MRRRWTVRLLLGLVVVQVVLLVVLDQQALRREARAVEACTAAAREGDAAVRARLAATSAYAASAPTPPGERSLAVRLLARSAREVAPDVQRARETCDDVDVRPWHPGTRAGRDAVVEYLDARAGQLRCLADGGPCYDDAAVPGLAELRERAFAAYEAGCPVAGR